MKKLIIASACLFMFVSCDRKIFTAEDAKITDRVVQWQIENFSDTIPALGWVHGALYRGMAEWAGATDAQYLYDFLVKIGSDNDWGMLERTYDADDLCIGQTYFKLYDRYADQDMIAKLKERVDSVMAVPSTESLWGPKMKYSRDRWGWCDALFMAPPVYARLSDWTGEEKYLDFCFSEFQVTADSLYDHADHLFIRDLRFKNALEENGEKLFWGRGNGWVYAGLATMLQLTSPSHPSYGYYLNMYKEMTPPIIRCQDATGSWHTGLYDPAGHPEPESSASGFFVYGLAWGVNNGILTESLHKESAIKGWNALKKNVGKDGRLGYVQAIGHKPFPVAEDSTIPYGAGAFLMAATEMKKMEEQYAGR